MYIAKKTYIFIISGLLLGVVLSVFSSQEAINSQSEFQKANSTTDSQQQLEALLKNKKLKQGQSAMYADDADLEALDHDSKVKSRPKPRFIFPKQNSPREVSERYETSKSVVGSTTQSSFDNINANKNLDSDKLPDSAIFSGEELEQLKKSGAEISVGSSSSSGLIGGVRSEKSNSQTNTQVAENNNQVVTPTATPEPEILYSGQVRGYELFYLMQPEARQTVETQIQALIDSNLAEIYLGILADGSFGKDYVYLRQVLDRLHANERSITLAIYAVNGPSMRQYDTTKIISPYTRIEPKKFRQLIQTDEATREIFRKQLAELKPVLEYNLKLNPKNSNIFVVMLEDNLDSESYLAMRNLAKTELGSLVEFMRSPCEGCYQGNDSLSFGDALILHDPDRILGLGPGDAFSLDGVGIRNVGSTGSAREISMDQIKAYQQLAYQRGLRFFAYWDGERQGLSPGNYPAPASRNYAAPSSEQMLAEQELLRDGLTPSKTPDP